MAREKRKPKPAKPKVVRPKPEKITGEELEAKFEAWREDQRSRRSARTAEQNHNVVRRVATGALCLMIVAIAVGQGVLSAGHDNERVVNQKQITELQTQVALFESAPEAEVVTAESVTELSLAASALAEKVADAQNKFATLYAKASDEMRSPEGNGAPGPAQEAVGEHRSALEKYFAQDSLLVDKADVPVFTSLPSFDEDEIDPRYEWYVRYDKDGVSDAKAYSWRVETVMPQLEEPTTASVVWVNTDTESGKVLAWVSAVYDQESGTFMDLDLVTTSFGAKYVQTLPLEQDSKTEVPEMIEDVK